MSLLLLFFFHFFSLCDSSDCCKDESFCCRVDSLSSASLEGAAVDVIGSLLEFFFKVLFFLLSFLLCNKLRLRSTRETPHGKGEEIFPPLPLVFFRKEK